MTKLSECDLKQIGLQNTFCVTDDEGSDHFLRLVTSEVKLGPYSYRENRALESFTGIYHSLRPGASIENLRRQGLEYFQFPSEHDMHTALLAERDFLTQNKTTTSWLLCQPFCPPVNQPYAGNPCNETGLNHPYIPDQLYYDHGTSSHTGASQTSQFSGSNIPSKASGLSSMPAATHNVPLVEAPQPNRQSLHINKPPLSAKSMEKLRLDILSVAEREFGNASFAPKDIVLLLKGVNEDSNKNRVHSCIISLCETKNLQRLGVGLYKLLNSQTHTSNNT